MAHFACECTRCAHKCANQRSRFLALISILVAREVAVMLYQLYVGIRTGKLLRPQLPNRMVECGVIVCVPIYFRMIQVEL